MTRKKSGPKKGTGLNPYGQFRAAIQLKRIGSEIVHVSSNDTMADVKHDYPLLFEEVKQLGRYWALKAAKGQAPTADDVLRDFRGKGILVGDDKVPGYATHDDIEQFLKSKESDFRFTRDLMAKRLGLKSSVIDTYLKPHRKKNKKP